jgi:hypothetical protein
LLSRLLKWCSDLMGFSLYFLTTFIFFTCAPWS